MGWAERPNAEAAAAAVTAGSPQGTATEDNRGRSGHGSGALRRSQRRTPRLAGAREERGGDAGKDERRGPSGHTNHDHPPAGASGGGRGTSAKRDRRQEQGRASASDRLAPTPTHHAEADPASPNNGSATTEATRSGGVPGGAAAAAAAAAPHGRKAAATRVQSLFRGHKGRGRAAAESRKRARRLAAEREAREEEQRPSAAACRRRGGRISRPKGRSTYGF